MIDRIFLTGMVFVGRHGVPDAERAEPQEIEVDLEVQLDLAAAGESDDLAATVDYAELFEVCRRAVEERSFHLLEAIAERIASDALAGYPRIDAVVVRVSKPGVPIEGRLESAGVAIERRRGAG